MVNEPTFVLDSKNGGMNWGKCIEEKETPPFDYKSVVEVSTLPGSETKYIKI